MKLIFHNMQKGVSLYLSLLILGILLAIVLTLSAILLGQIRMIKGIGDSVIAFYAADTGIEKVLVYRANPLLLPEPSGTLENNSSYTITVILPGPNCTASNYCIRSVGDYKETRRAIEVEY